MPSGLCLMCLLRPGDGQSGAIWNQDKMLLFLCLVHVLSTVIISLTVFHRRQQFQVSAFFSDIKPQTAVQALSISTLYLLHRLPNLAASLSICSFFSPSTAALVFT